MAVDAQTQSIDRRDFGGDFVHGLLQANAGDPVRPGPSSAEPESNRMSVGTIKRSPTRAYRAVAQHLTQLAEEFRAVVFQLVDAIGQRNIELAAEVGNLAVLL